MRIPIQYALTYPERVPAPEQRLSLDAMRRLDFSTPDRGRFRCLELAYQALEAGGAATCALNAADEIAVEEFLGGNLRFSAIPEVIEQTLEKVGHRPASTLDEILDCDRAARETARRLAASEVAARGAVRSE